MKLDKWSVIKASDKKNSRLTGKVYGHPVFSDGDAIFTSFIVGKEGDKIKTSSGCVFELMEPSRLNYLKNPNAKEDLLTSL